MRTIDRLRQGFVLRKNRLSDPIQQPDVAVAEADVNSGTLHASGIPGLKEITAKPIGKSMWMPVAILFLALVVVAYATRNSGTAVAGLSVGELISIELILFLSGLMSGLSGFGFSAVGAGCLPGSFVGIWMLSHLPSEQLMNIFGVLLILYSVYSMFKPAGTPAVPAGAGKSLGSSPGCHPGSARGGERNR